MTAKQVMLAAAIERGDFKAVLELLSEWGTEAFDFEIPVGNSIIIYKNLLTFALSRTIEPARLHHKAAREERLNIFCQLLKNFPTLIEAQVDDVTSVFMYCASVAESSLLVFIFNTVEASFPAEKLKGLLTKNLSDYGNLLLYAALEKEYDFFQYLYNKAKSLMSKEAFCDWIMRSTDEGWSVLECAAYNGNPNIIQFIFNNIPDFLTNKQAIIGALKLAKRFEHAEAEVLLTQKLCRLAQPIIYSNFPSTSSQSEETKVLSTRVNNFSSFPAKI